MSGWFVELVGDRCTLDVLAEFSFAPGVELLVDGDQLLLGGTEIDQATTAVNAHAKAEEILPLLNGVAAVRNAHLHPLSVGSQVFRRCADGTRSWVSSCFSAQVNFLRGSYSWYRGTSPSPTGRWLPVSRGSAAIQTCLRLLGRSGNDWRALANILEIISADVGQGSKTKGEKRIAARGWLTREEMRLFRHTANHPGASGDAARHGYVTTIPPAVPMLVPEAKAMIRSLLAHWIEAKADESPRLSARKAEAAGPAIARP